MDLQSVNRIVILGDAAVGKTSLALRHFKGTFSPTYTPTNGMKYFTPSVSSHSQATSPTIINKNMTTTPNKPTFNNTNEGDRNNKESNATSIIKKSHHTTTAVWDLSGDPDYRAVVRSYYTNVDGFIFVCRCDDVESLHDIATEWEKDVMDQLDGNDAWAHTTRVLVATHVDTLYSTPRDLFAFRSEALRMATTHNMKYYEVDNVHGVNTSSVFRTVFDDDATPVVRLVNPVAWSADQHHMLPLELRQRVRALARSGVFETSQFVNFVKEWLSPPQGTGYMESMDTAAAQAQIIAPAKVELTTITTQSKKKSTSDDIHSMMLQQQQNQHTTASISSSSVRSGPARRLDMSFDDRSRVPDPHSSGAADDDLNVVAPSATGCCGCFGRAKTRRQRVSPTARDKSCLIS
eukprot:PhM_4_TR245/c0_g1_i1/m.104843